MSEGTPLRIMVSSAVYGIELLLDRIFAILEGYGYEVWMSHKGTVPTDSRRSNFENCLAGVESCDLFLGIITGRYGSRVPSELSITHQEIRRAIELNKLRWFLAHHHVTLARQLLTQFRGPDGRGWSVPIARNAILEDARIIEMYEEAIRQDIPLEERTGNWVQPYVSDEDVFRFLATQFRDPGRIRSLLSERGSA
jgi:hypothetical protein